MGKYDFTYYMLVLFFVLANPFPASVVGSMVGANRVVAGLRAHTMKRSAPPLKSSRVSHGRHSFLSLDSLDESVSENSSDQEELNMHLAAVEKHLESIKCLVKTVGGSVQRSASWESALSKVNSLPKLFDLEKPNMRAQSKGHKEGVLSDCSNSGESTATGEALAERICNAAFKGDLEDLKTLITTEEEVDSSDYFDRSALQLAAAEGHASVVEFLLSRGAKVDVTDKWGSCALSDAVRGNHQEVYGLLIAAGASKGHISEDPWLLKRAREERWCIERKDVKMGNMLGEGDQGYVFKSEWRGMPVVCKVLKDHENAVKDLEFQNEIAVLSHLRHPNLVLFLGACLDREPKFILTEYLPGGSLEDVFDQQREENGAPWKPPTHQVLSWATDLARALCFLHKQSPAVLHRDLKPANLLLDENNHLKLSDFGLSKCLEKRASGGDYTMTGETGTLRYMAPEVVRHENYDETVDVYSFGFVLWYMCTGELPLDGVTQEELVQAAGAHEELRPDVSRVKLAPLRDLMRRCWSGDVSRRPTAEEILVELNAMSARFGDCQRSVA